MELVNEAVSFALKAHNGMRRKTGNAPYILHPLEAAVIAGTMTDDQEIISAAVLHDVVEDTSITIDEIEKSFGHRIRCLVESETENKREELPAEISWRIRKEESLEVLKNAEDIGVLIIWLADKLSNMRSFYREWKVDGDAMWQRFNQKDTEQQEWYYRSVAELTKKLSHNQAWIEYNTLTELLFGKGN